MNKQYRINIRINGIPLYVLGGVEVRWERGEFNRMLEIEEVHIDAEGIADPELEAFLDRPEIRGRVAYLTK